MIRVRNAVVISRPVDAVYAYATDLDRAATWQSGLKGVRLVSGEGMGEGARVLHKRSFLGRSFETISTVQTWDPPTRFTTQDADGGAFVMREDLTLDPAGGATRLTYEIDVDLRTFLRNFEPAMGLIFARRINNDFLRLKAALEA